MIDRLDHLAIGIPGLDLAEAAFGRAGFLVSPRNRHASFGTGNVLVMFADDYLELIAFLDPEPLDSDEKRAMKKLFGPMPAPVLVALASNDAIADQAALAARGIDFTGPSRWSRAALIGGRETVASFTTSAALAPQLARPLVTLCQHHTPAAVFDPALAQHPNTATALLAIDLPWPDPASSADAMGILFGPDRVKISPPAISVTPRRGPLLRLVEGGPTRVIFRVDDLRATRRTLAQGGLVIMPDSAMPTVELPGLPGVVLTFTEELAA